MRNRNGRFQKKRSVVEIAWAKNGTPHTLSSSASSVEITDLTAQTFNQFMSHLIQVTGNINSNWQLDGVTNSDYARRRSRNGGTDSTEVSQTSSNMGNGTGSDILIIGYAINVDSEEKLIIANTCEAETAGAGTAPSRTEYVGKMDTSTNSGQFTQVKISESSAGSYDTDSNLSALGTD